MKSEMTDIVLLKKVSERETVFFEMLYKRYNRLFYRWVYTRIGNKEMTEEIAQLFWIHIWEDPSYFINNSNNSVKDFFLRILTFKTLDYLKSAASRKSGSQFLLAEADKLFSYTHILEEIQVNEIQEVLDKALEDLPLLTKDVFLMLWEKDYSVNETAERLNISPKMVRTRYQATLSFLKKNLSDKYNEEELSDYMTFILLLVLIK